jgi:hypothetical protein
MSRLHEGQVHSEAAVVNALIESPDTLLSR